MSALVYDKLSTLACAALACADVDEKVRRVAAASQALAPIVSLTARGTRPFVLVFLNGRDELATTPLGVLPDEAFLDYRVRVPRSVLRRGYTSLYLKSATDDAETRLALSRLALEAEPASRAK